MTRLRNICMAAASAVVLLAGGQRASAESVSLAFDKSVNGAVSLSGNPGGPYTQPGPFYWHDNGLPPNSNFPPPTSTFCIEVNGPLPAVGSSAVFAVLPIATDLGTVKAALITELYGRYYNTAWDSASFTGSLASISFQLALWELAIDGASKNLALPNFTASASLGTVVSDAQAMLNALNGDTSSFYSRFANKELVALVSPDPNSSKPQDYQDQITLRNKPAGVPAPPGVILAGIGFLGLIGRGRWLRRSQAAV